LRRRLLLRWLILRPGANTRRNKRAQRGAAENTGAAQTMDLN
jgi:hypothetical protein